MQNKRENKNKNKQADPGGPPVCFLKTEFCECSPEKRTKFRLLGERGVIVSPCEGLRYVFTSDADGIFGVDDVVFSGWQG